MNKQGNTYTILYSAVMVVVVAAILAIASVSLRPFQQENIRIDKMMQTALPYVPDIHRRPFPHSLKSFQHLDTVRGILLFRSCSLFVLSHIKA